MSNPPRNPWIEAKRRAKEARRRQWVRDHERPDRRAAWDALRAAIASCKVSRQPCELAGPDCEGPEARAEFHHTHGYAEEHQLTGLWVCRPCHVRLHKAEARRARKRAAKEAAEGHRGRPGVLILDD